MMKLTDCDWKAFNAFGKDGFFEIHATNSSIDKSKLNDGNNNDLPYITRSNNNNGLAMFVDDSNKANGFDTGNSITIGLDTQTAFYQPHPFVTGQNIQIITGKNIDADTAQFLIPLFRQQMIAKFNWGGNGATLKRMKLLKILLPINDKGEPDFDFMRDYVREHTNYKSTLGIQWVNQHLQQLKYVQNLPKLNDINWGVFRLSTLFEISRPKSRSKSKYKSGNVPFIASGADNNGVTAMLAPKKDEELDAKNCITISPVDGSSFYQPMNFLGRGGGGSSMIILRSTRLNKYNGLFMAKMINQTFGKYSYGHMASSKTAGREIIMLPITQLGKPDYEYIEQYVKNLMIKKYKQYFTIIQDRKK